MKKLMVLLCAAVMLAVLPLAARAASEDEVQAVIAGTRRSYSQSLASAGVESFAGFCGKMTSHQLYNLGINEWCVSNDGNKQFEYYKDLERSSGGFYITPYSAEDYSLAGALHHITRDGTRDAYNLLVCFDWTNTEAGGIYGHAVFINAILDGTVYFVESFYTSIGGPEGSVIACSITEFAAYFAPWTLFEGIIHFGSGGYADSCTHYDTDVFLQARFDTVLRSQPCLLGQNDCLQMRSIAPGERLRATALLENEHGDMYYRVEDSVGTGYVAAGAVSVVRLNAEDMFAQDVTFPEVVQVGEKLSPEGAVRAVNSTVGTVEIVVTDSLGNILLRERETVEAASCQLSRLGQRLGFDLLDEGFYQVEVYGEAACAVALGPEPVTRYERIRLWGQVVQVGGKLRIAKAQPVMQEGMPQTHDGWFWENGSWYCYKYGKPCTGWVSHCGVEYYLDENGAALTGWQEIDGWTRYFSATGAMVTGHLVLDGERCCFDENGILQEKGQT